MKTLLGSALICLCLAAPAFAQTSPAWRGHAGDEQHNAQAPAAGQKLAKLHWNTRIDLQPSAYIHYGSPMLTAANTILFPVKTTAMGGFQIEARDGGSGTLLWQADTKYIVPPTADWVPSFPAHLTAQNRLYYADQGGTVRFRDKPDARKGPKGQLAFFGIANYQAHPKPYNTNVMIDTPITADDAGDIFFGFVVMGKTPLKLQSGIARIGADGTGTWISAAKAANDSDITQVAMNSAPAISRDQTTIYIGVSNGTNGYLVGLDSTTLQPKYQAQLTDPATGQAAVVTDLSSAAPTIGPDNDVYYGVLESPATSHNCRGWLLHFDAGLDTTKIPGSFGWDDTVSVVPASIVPSYKGTSAYLVMTKYNNYLGCGLGDGRNRIAILDPDASQQDQYSKAQVMKEVLTILSPANVPGQRKSATYEWCINSAVVDVANKSVIANAEDGYSYRWDLTTNKLSEKLNLNPPTSEAYTPTLIGPDGTVYAINDGVLYALGN
jgi:hypothetical protein